jgi:pyruvate,water dikinase
MFIKWYRKYKERRREEKSEQADRQLNALRFRYHAFKNLLLCNNDLLEQITRLEAYLEDNRKIFPGLRARVDLLLKLARELVQNLNHVAGSSYLYLFDVLQRISSRLKTLARELDPGDKVPLVLPLHEAHIDLVSIVGGKAAPLGNVKNTLNLPVPDGFVLTTEACQLFFDSNQLLPAIRDLLRSLHQESPLREIEAVSHKVRDLILGARIPQELRDSMDEAFERLTGQPQAAPCNGIAVRSSAIPEDGRYSFAGQFRTVLNIMSKEDFLKAYKEVIASNFNENSLIYRLHREMGFQEADMAVLCLAMVPARSAGTLYTVDPNDPESERMVVCSIWGLGEYLVNGRLPSDIFHVSRLDMRRFEVVHLARKVLKLVCDPERGGTKEEAIDEADSLRFSLSEDEIQTLCEYSMKVEKYLGYPQDIEWAVSESGDIIILQARRLQIGGGVEAASRKSMEELTLLMERGTTASKGQAVGTIARVAHERDTDTVEPGSIVVAGESLLTIAKIMDRVRGIVLEGGNPLEHLACVAREYRVPMLVKATNAMDLLEDGLTVTLDADEARIYAGEAKLLGTGRTEMDLQRRPEPETPNPTLEELRKLIFPLNLLEVRDPYMQMASCQSVHDVIRFCHEQGIQAMFELNDGEYLKNKFYVSRLDTPIAFMVDIINLGGGFSVGGHPQKVTIEEISSVPFLALWKGVSHEGIRWSGPPARVNLKALSSVVSNTMLDTARSGRALGSRSYALISRDYMNLNTRLAYHFAMVDALCGHNAAENYINFRFKGGGTGLERRMLRVRFIARILEDLGFFVNLKQDLLNATLKGLPIKELVNKLDMVGRLLGCSRLLDMAMDDEETMQWFVTAFQQGNYGFEPDFEPDGSEN